MATRKTNKVTPSATIARFNVSKDMTIEREYTGIDWQAANDLSNASGKFESSIVLGFFVCKAAPSFDDYKAYVKGLEGKHPVPTKRSHNALYITLSHAGKIQEAIDSGFNALAAWNDSVAERTRKTEPNISALRKLARVFMDGEKVADPIAEFNKALVAAWKKANALQNNATSQYNVKTLEAIAAKNKIDLPKEVN